MDFERVKEAGALLRKFTRTRSLHEGRTLHSQLTSSGYDGHTFLGNLLVHMYGSCGSLPEAKLAFERISPRNCFSWNILLTANAHNGHLLEAEEAFAKTPHHNLVSMTAMITAYTRLGHLDSARRLFDRIPEKCVVSWNAIMMGYALNGDINQAKSLFDMTPERTIVSWNALLSAYVRTGDIQVVSRISDLMPFHDIVCWNSLLAAYARKGHLVEASSLFVRMAERSVFSVTAMIEVSSKSGCLELAREYFDRMPERDVVAWTTMATAYAENGDLHECRRVFEEIPVKDEVAWSAVISSYSKSGSLEEARAAFNELGEHPTSSWNALIAAFTQNGKPHEALRHFKLMDMEGVQPDSITFSSVIDACAELTDLSTGRAIHAEMKGFNLDTVVVTSLVCLYARCGMLDLAFEMFVRVPLQDKLSWNTMITAYAQNGEARHAVELLRIMALEGGHKPDKVSFLSVLSACSHEGLAEDGCDCFVSMRDHGVEPDMEHYVCMVDILARAGRLDVAEDLIKNSPFEPSCIQWKTLLGACRVQEDVEQAVSAARMVSRVTRF